MREKFVPREKKTCDASQAARKEGAATGRIAEVPAVDQPKVRSKKGGKRVKKKMEGRPEKVRGYDVSATNEPSLSEKNLCDTGARGPREHQAEKKGPEVLGSQPGGGHDGGKKEKEDHCKAGRGPVLYC